eukprot:GHVS01002528.1.p1 GENE.GHVS01002528.1~~GHVS01002528.1.p1  ORF type:complete len:901 (-),score=188.66 GHVS01002528.1:570-3272(-)
MNRTHPTKTTHHNNYYNLITYYYYYYVTFSWRFPALILSLLLLSSTTTTVQTAPPPHSGGTTTTATTDETLFRPSVLLRQPTLTRQPPSSTSSFIPVNLPDERSIQNVSSIQPGDSTTETDPHSKYEEAAGVSIGAAVVAQLLRTSRTSNTSNKTTTSSSSVKQTEQQQIQQSFAGPVKGRVLVALSQLSHKQEEGGDHDGSDNNNSLAKLEQALRSSGDVAAAVRTEEQTTWNISSPSSSPSSPHDSSGPPPTPSVLNRHAHDNPSTQIIRSYRVLRNVGLVIVDFHPLVSVKEVDSEISMLWNDHPEVWMIEADTEVSFRGAATEEENQQQPVTDKQTEEHKEQQQEEGNDVDGGNRGNKEISVAHSGVSVAGDSGGDSGDGDGGISVTVGVSQQQQEGKHPKMDTSGPQKKYSSVASFPPFIAEPLIPTSFLPSTADIAKSIISAVAGTTKQNAVATAAVIDDSQPSTKNRKNNNQLTSFPPTPAAASVTRDADNLPNDSLFTKQWSLNNDAAPYVDVRASSAWALSYDASTGKRKLGRSGLLIGHIDTGCDVNHPDLINSIWTNPGEIAGNGIDDDGNGYVDDIHGWNFDGDNADVTDEHGHGTHTAGIVGAEANNNKGISGLIWDAKMIILKFKNNVSDAVQAIEYCLTMGIRVSTNSWGFNTPVESLKLVLQRANDMKHLFVCAVDNKGRDNTWFNDFPPNYPFPNMIRVASINSNADLDVTSDFSKTKVDIAAPGKGIISSVPRAIYGSDYAMKDGTSMATPLVAGLVGLLLSADPNLDIYRARSIIMSTVTPLTAIESRILTGGIINCENAIKSLLNLPYSTPEAIVVPSLESRAPVDLLGDAGHVSEMLLSGFNDFMSGLLTRYSRSVDMVRRSVAVATLMNRNEQIGGQN